MQWHGLVNSKDTDKELKGRINSAEKGLNKAEAELKMCLSVLSLFMGAVFVCPSDEYKSSIHSLLAEFFLREISGSFTVKCSSMFTSYSLTVSVCCWVVSVKWVFTAFSLNMAAWLKRVTLWTVDTKQ